MKRILFFTIGLLMLQSMFAQKGDELLVYSLKGNVTVIENNKESKLKVGRVLKPGATIKTQKLSKLTMVCKEGKPISVTKEGSFPLSTWKDSCQANSANSVTARYFSYIWDQLYARSDDYKREHRDDPAGNMIAAPVRGSEDAIFFNEQLDTIIYANGNFPLSWTTSFIYTGKFYFALKDDKTGKIVYKDSVATSSIRLEKLKKYMKPGRLYTWSVATRKSGEYDGGVIKYVSAASIQQLIKNIQQSVTVPEELAARYFRTAYLLQEEHYFADALIYYQRSAIADPSTSFYKEKLEEFKTSFSIN